VPRRNHRKGRRPQARRGANGAAMYLDMPVQIRNGLPQKPQKQKNRPDLLPMVPSSGHCPTGKIRYGTEEDAQEALRRAIINREVLKSEVREERYYPQPGDKPCECEGYHLTHTPRRMK
jgi:hypothetical protein